MCSTKHGVAEGDSVTINEDKRRKSLVTGIENERNYGEQKNQEIRNYRPELSESFELHSIPFHITYSIFLSV